MSKTTGGLRKIKIGTSDGGGNYGGEVDSRESLSAIPNKKTRLEVQGAISKFESRLKLKTRVVMLAKIEGAYGVAKVNGNETEVYLNSEYYKADNSFSKIVEDKNKAYKAGWSVKTNKPIQHTTVHELGHALWSTHKTDKNSVAAKKSISNLFSRYKADWRKGKVKGEYATTNVNEFFAEIVTKGVIGTPDRYTKSLWRIIKKYKLTI